MTIFFDLSRVLLGGLQVAPSGIDRVELAYAKFLPASMEEEVIFVAGWRRLVRLPTNTATELVDAVDRLWAGAIGQKRGAESVRALINNLRWHTIWRSERSIFEFSSRSATKPIYLRVSCHRIRSSPLERLKQHTGAKFIFFVHDLIPIEKHHNTRKSRVRHFSRQLGIVARMADTVIVNSRGTDQALKNYFADQLIPIPRTVVAPLGIDLRCPENPAFGGNDIPYFVCVGPIQWRKNQALLIEVWRRMAQNLGPGTPRLVLVGRLGRKSRSVIDAIFSSSELHESVVRHEALTDKALASLIRGARALLCPTLAEGYGLPVAEALSLGTPVICSDLDELRETGSNVPEYLNPQIPEDWERAVSNYMLPNSPYRRAQLDRLTTWRSPSWKDHFNIVRAVIRDSVDLRG